MLIKHFVIGCNNEFMYMIPKAKAIEVKVNKQNYIKLKKIFITNQQHKNVINSMKDNI